MGFFKIFTFLIGSREELEYEMDEEYGKEKEYDNYNAVTYISNDGLDGGEIIVEPSYIKN